MTRIVCGVDLSSTSLDASLGVAGPFAHFASTDQGIAVLAAFCHVHAVELTELSVAQSQQP